MKRKILTTIFTMRLRDYNRVIETSRFLFKLHGMEKKPFLSEDRHFRECFGCGANVVLKLWQMLEDKDLMPTKGTLEHLLRALMFMKVYPTEYIFASLTGKLDPKTNRLWNWKIISAIADLEPYLVSNLVIYLNKECLLLTCSLCFNRSFGKIEKYATGAMTVL